MSIPFGEGLEESGERNQGDTSLYPTEKVHRRWQDDELFGYQFLNGANPMLLRHSTCLPSRLVLPSGMEELQVQLEKELQVPPPTLHCPHLSSVLRAGEAEKGQQAVAICCPLDAESGGRNCYK